MGINGLEISKVNIHPVKEKKPDSNLEGFAEIVLNGQFVVKNLRIVTGKFGPFVSWPARKEKDGERYFETAHPITKEFSEYVNREVLAALKAAG